MDAKTFCGLAYAGLSCIGAAGSRTKSHNSVLRSSRGRRRAFEKEMYRMKIAHEKEFGPITDWPEATDEAINQRCEEDKSFALFIANINRLRCKWL